MRRHCVNLPLTYVPIGSGIFSKNALAPLRRETTCGKYSDKKKKKKELKNVNLANVLAC